ncbi:MAG: DUF4292 domain-containing protein [Bacteroidales bacterium]|nr:DUF4292 domain-containing protein [Bacteroidales bacterium]
MNKSNVFHYVYIILIIMSLCFSCSVKKKITTADKSSAICTSEKQLMDSVLQRYFNAEYLTAQFKATLTTVEAKNVSINGLSQYVADSSLISVNILMLGMNAATAYICEDSIVIVNKLQRNYKVLNYDDLSEEFGLNFNYKSIEDALFGRIINNFVTTAPIFQYVDNEYVMKYNNGFFNYVVSVGSDYSLKESLISNMNDEVFGSIGYDDYFVFSKPNYIPQSVYCSLPAVGDINISFSKHNFDKKPVNVVVPKNYVKVN